MAQAPPPPANDALIGCSQMLSFDLWQWFPWKTVNERLPASEQCSGKLHISIGGSECWLALFQYCIDLVERLHSFEHPQNLTRSCHWSKAHSKTFTGYRTHLQTSISWNCKTPNMAILINEWYIKKRFFSFLCFVANLRSLLSLSANSTVPSSSSPWSPFTEKREIDVTTDPD